MWQYILPAKYIWKDISIQHCGYIIKHSTLLTINDIFLVLAEETALYDILLDNSGGSEATKLSQVS